MPLAESSTHFTSTMFFDWPRQKLTPGMVWRFLAARCRAASRTFAFSAILNARDSDYCLIVDNRQYLFFRE